MNQKSCTCWTSGSFLFIFQLRFLLPGCCTATVIVDKTTRWILMETRCSWPVNRVLYSYEISQQNASNT